MPRKQAIANKATTKKMVAKTIAAKEGGSESSPRRASVAPRASEARLACPRCGTEKFGPEDRTRVEGRRTVRYTVLVCERGHTFAKPAPFAKPALKGGAGGGT